MPLNIGGPPFRLNAEEAGGSPSYFDAIQRGIRGFGENAKVAYTPKTLAENLLAQQLQNKIRGTQAKYAEPLAQASLRAKNNSLSLFPLRQKFLESQIKEKMDLQNSKKLEQEFYNKNPFLKIKGLPQNLVGLAALNAFPEYFSGGNLHNNQEDNEFPYTPSFLQTENKNDSLSEIRKSLIENIKNKGNNSGKPYSARPTGDVATQAWINEQRNLHGDTPEIQNYQKYLDSKSSHIKSLESSKEISDSLKRRQEMGWAWQHEPNDVKIADIGQLAGAGYTTNEASKLLSEGNTVPDLLKKSGFDPKNPPDSIAINTPADRTQVNKQKSSLAELKYVEDFVANGLGPYSQTILGYSPSQIKDALSGKNKQQQIDFLAARALSPELTNLRLLVANARATIPALKSLSEKSLTNINAIRPLVGKDVWQKVQHKVGNILQEAGVRSNSARLNSNNYSKKISNNNYNVSSAIAELERRKRNKNE